MGIVIGTVIQEGPDATAAVTGLPSGSVAVSPDAQKVLLIHAP